MEKTMQKTIAQQDALITQLGEALRQPMTLDGQIDKMKALLAYTAWEEKQS